jgi:S-adenosylmethionine-diacylgycerolhomoserine-N-methlytransferase
MNDNRLVQQQRMDRYYRFHSMIYDATRWSFLFGRQHIIELTDTYCKNPKRILEVGCGTGRNLRRLHKVFPDAQLTGLDISGPMLRIATSKCVDIPNIKLIHTAYDRAIEPKSFDLILFSYVLSMVNPGFEDCLSSSRHDLQDDGILAIADFDSSRFFLFKSWMARNHVRMDSQIRTELQHSGWQHVDENVCSAYGGLWTYMTGIYKPR